MRTYFWSYLKRSSHEKIKTVNHGTTLNQHFHCLHRIIPSGIVKRSLFFAICFCSNISWNQQLLTLLRCYNTVLKGFRVNLSFKFHKLSVTFLPSINTYLRLGHTANQMEVIWQSKLSSNSASNYLKKLYCPIFYIFVVILKIWKWKHKVYTT